MFGINYYNSVSPPLRPPQALSPIASCPSCLIALATIHRPCPAPIRRPSTWAPSSPSHRKYCDRNLKWHRFRSTANRRHNTNPNHRNKLCSAPPPQPSQHLPPSPPPPVHLCRRFAFASARPRASTPPTCPVTIIIIMHQPSDWLPRTISARASFG